MNPAAGEPERARSVHFWACPRSSEGRQVEGRTLTLSLTYAQHLTVEGKEDSFPLEDPRRQQRL